MGRAEFAPAASGDTWRRECGAANLIQSGRVDSKAGVARALDGEDERADNLFARPFVCQSRCSRRSQPIITRAVRAR